MPLEFVKSERGADKLAIGSHLFIKDKELSGGQFWKCEKFQKFKCRKRLHVVGENIVKEIGEHNHAGDVARVKATKIKNTIKERAAGTQETNHLIVANAVAEASQAVVGHLPAIENLKRTARRAHAKTAAAPANPQSLDELVIPLNYSTTRRGQPFLLYDSNDGNNRILIFSTRQNLEMMAQTEHWYADGTFATVPQLFGQLYTIHAIRFNCVLPSIFTLLPNKNRETYRRLFSQLKNLEPTLNPTSIMTDFELASIGAFRDEFPDAIQCGCFFHFNQCIYRNIQANGLQREYENNEAFALKMRMIPALAFVPVAEVTHSFEALCEHGDFPPDATPVLDYFEDTWIGRPTRRGNRRPPRLAHDLWNCNASVRDGLPKTNNSVEGWHRGFEELLKAHHPTIWKFINAIKTKQSLTEVKVEQYVTGHQPPRGRRVYREVADRIAAIVDRFENTNILDYLRGLAHNYGF